MLKALVLKESRELMPLVALAIVAELLFFLPAGLIPIAAENTDSIPFVSTWLQTWLLIIGGMTAVAMGFWQTSGELARGTLLFLLHRPVDRSTIFAIKLLVGISVTLLIAGVPIFAFALWAAAPGTHASPFFWSMTTTTWLIWFRLPLFYLGAFLSGLRPGRWFGSRALPLAAALPLFILLAVTSQWPAVTLLLTLAIEACYLWVIFFIASTRDYS
jgi:ABC-type transport system involved in multi-copper enzyme maturation permease subunit